MEDLDDILPLFDIRLLIDEDKRPSEQQLYRWSRGIYANDFPEPVRTLGRYKFYSATEVIEWYTLWCRATRRYTKDNMRKV